MTDLKPTIIRLTPLRNEEWILHRFLACASRWADLVLLLDDGSTDRSRDIAARFPKARVVDNASGHCHEPQRRQRLLEVAREYAAPRLLLALDCDEALTANYTSSPEWQTILRAPAGTVVWFTLLNLCPDMAKCWQVSYPFPFGLMDDGSDFSTSILHGTRIPTPHHSSRVHLRDSRVLHYQIVR